MNHVRYAIIRNKPYLTETEQGVALAILRGNLDFKREPWPQISDNAKNLVKQMLDPDPKKRLTAQQVLDHPCIQNAKKASNVPLGDIVRSRLKQFAGMNRFKKKALRVMAENLPDEEIKGLKQMFNNIDTDRSGTITLEKLKAGLARLGSRLNETEIQQLMEAANVDNNGSIDYMEFITATMHRHRLDKDENIL